MVSEEPIISNPKILEMRRINSCKIWGDRYKHAYLDLTVNEKTYRIKEEALLSVLTGQVVSLYIVPKYDREYLELDPPKRKS